MVRIIVLKEQTKSMPFYVTRVGVSYKVGEITRLNGFEEFQIMHVISGEGIFECGGKTYSIKENDVVLFYPDIPHRYYPIGEQDWILNWVCFGGRGCKNVLDEIVCAGYAVIKNVKSSKLSLNFERLIDVLKIDTIYFHFQASSVLYDMFIELIAHGCNLYDENTLSIQLQPVIEYMWKHLPDNIIIEELSDAINVSVSYLCRIFKLVYGTSPIKYLIMLRLLTAKNLLLMNPERTINEISKECGYNDVSYFCAEFKRYFNITPASLKNKF